MSFSTLIRTIFKIKPRKLSKLLRISSKYHKGWGGCREGMCTAARSAQLHGELTKVERDLVQRRCQSLANQFGRVYLCSGLEYKMKLEGDSIGYCRLVYEDWIDKLESEGK